MINKQKLLLSTLALSVALSMSTPIVAPEPVQAAGFKSFNKKLRKNFKKNTRKFKRAMRDPKTRRLLQGVGAALIFGGLGRHSSAAAIIGVILIAAPEIFQRDFEKSYRSDLDWSGCTRCTNARPRAVTVPGRKVSAETKRASISRVKEDIKDIQRALKVLGLYKKSIDGDFGPGTRAGVKEFQRSLGVNETRILSAEQRYRLFIQAEQKGYERQAVLDVIDKDAQTEISKILPIVPAVVTPPENVIEEYALAKSQFEIFNEQYLQSGNQGMVLSANLLADGRIELTLKDTAGQTAKAVTGVINDIAVNPHKLSDQWIRIVYQDGSMSEPLTLNTRDDFPSTEAATAWMTQAKNKISLLEVLTEVAPKNPEVRIAGMPPTSQSEDEKVEPPVPVKIAEAPVEPPVPEKTTEAPVEAPVPVNVEKAPVEPPVPVNVTKVPDEVPVPVPVNIKKDPVEAPVPVNVAKAPVEPPVPVIVAEAPVPVKIAEPPVEPPVPVKIAEAPKDSGMDESKPKVSDLQPGQKAVGSDGKIVIANNDNMPTVQENPSSSSGTRNISPNNNGKVGNTLTGFDAQVTKETCRQNIYVSFLFPDGETPITHYNITPPVGTIMIDNGDSTAYFTGSCIQGNYGFSYVYVKEAKQKKDWKHFKRKGAFQIASNSEQCAIDLNTPEKSASLQCF